MTTTITAAGLLGPVGTVSYVVDRLDDAVTWYAQRLGRQPELSGSALAAFDIDGVRLVLHVSATRTVPRPANGSAYWTVPDVDRFVADWTAHGATALRGPKTIFFGERLCQLLDPFGNLFSIRQATP